MRESLLTILMVLTTSLMAQDCAPGWSFYRNVTIDNSAGPALTDYQVKVRLNTSELAAAETLNDDGSDLRVFAEDCTPLPFWGDSLGVSEKTDLWVKLPSIAAGASVTIQVYYGRPQAESVADGDNTFLFFDDFNSGIVDAAKWETIGEFADFSVTDGILNYASTAMNPGPRFKFARTVPTFTEPVIFDYNCAVTNSNGFGFSSGDVDLDRILFRQSGGFGFDTINLVAIMQDTISNGFAVETNYPLLPFPRSQFNTHSITAGVNASQQLTVTNYGNVGLETENTTIYTLESDITMSSFHFIMSAFSTGATLLDNIRVRQLTATPPTSTTGNELMATPSSVDLILAANDVQVYPNPASDYCQIKVYSDERVTLSVHDVVGHQVAVEIRNNVPNADWTLNLSNLDRGVYFLQFRRQAGGELLHTRKVMVE